ncbi:unnamed protein product [Didymodactylos carnosus]|uniref:LEM domain-containing protein n=1 Tax=Didymodactylos carnosus TaxID=1234261 RepID=A0A813Y4C6_9BILA|nr:unnamed protein product [Didymodactylos carnosus]CAF0879887.1 unnamed protein product [Didymodactylos carnosus]CAF3660412.1 unnamed protein product [Didymodactylos carnosus]CAF3666244.1 unnamed protein product [Didymodactylos carnosus]
MATKNELQQKLKSTGYDISPYASKDTLSIMLRLHAQALEKGIDVPELNDMDLRKSLKAYDIHIGPVINLTRTIYQRKLLEVITKETTEGHDDDMEIDDYSSYNNTQNLPVRDRIQTRSEKSVFYDCE